MARFTTAGGSGDGTPGAPGPQGPAGEDAVLPQDLGTTDTPTFSTITLTSNGATNNITIGDDVILGDGNVANHVVIIGQQDATSGGIVLGTNETEVISTNGTDLSVTADNDIILNPGSTYAYLGTPEIDGSNRLATMGDITGVSGADIADFVFTNVDSNNSSITITGDKEMTIESGTDSDLNVRAGDQLWLTAGNDVILQADDTIQVRSLDGVEILSNYVDMGDAEHRWQFTQGAELILPGGGVIINAPESSSDGGLLSTLLLVPDGTNETNQFVVLDPTGPNHIHLRAGGPIDESTAELILGGERNKVVVSDSYKSVAITTAATITNTYVNAHEADNEDLIVPETSDILIGDNIVIAGIGHPVTYFSPDPNNTGFSIVRATGLTFVAGESYTFVREEPYENQWTFGSNGVLSGPAMGGVRVSGIMNEGLGSDLYIASNDANIQMLATNHVRLDASNGNVYINPSGGIYLGTSEVADNRIATIGDLSSAGTGDITFVNNTISSDTGDDIVIQNKDNSDIVKARIVLDQSNEQVLLEAINSSSSTFTTGDWTTATWSQNVIQINGTENGVIPFFSGLNGNVTHIQVNNGDIVQYDGASYGPTDLTMYTITNAPVESDPVTIESLRLIYGVGSKIDINYDNEEFLLQSNGMNLNLSSDQEINLDSSDDIDLSATNRVRIYGDTNVFINSNGGGEYIGTSVDDDFGNQIATVGNLNSTVSTDMVRFVPNFSATGLEYTGYDTTHPTYNSYYVKAGKMVTFVIEVDCATVTNFGTGQYQLQLPLMPAIGFNHFTGWVNVDTAVNPDVEDGHVILNVDHAGMTDTLDLHYLKQAGGAHTPIIEGLFVQGTPVTLTTSSKIYVNGTYIAQ